ncbi:MAG: UDP-glucose 4-epimerase GalE [Burkholderiales bacterium]|nr:UDP-glucose 4-epimerase GalE [Burkholderiales bacterium]
MRVLVTGGAGYIGSHTVLALHEAGHTPVVLDNLSNSKAASIQRVGELCGREFEFVRGDVRDSNAVRSTLEQYDCAAVIHLAGLKSVAESTTDPDAYFDNNVTGSIGVLRAMRQAGVKRFIFSSSATVYASRDTPCAESDQVAPSNPYGATKLAVEVLLQSLSQAQGFWHITSLRYFNPVGAHQSGRIGEDPSGEPANLVPYLTQVLTGRRRALRIFGTDYPTPDGTGLRDYIHVMDLAEGHVAALNAPEAPAFSVYNLGTGKATSVLEMIAAFEAATGKRIPLEHLPRRPGDIPFSCALVEKACNDLGWKARRSLKEMCEDAWRWQQANPLGYD